jgi:hypothetical protein
MNYLFPRGPSYTAWLTSPLIGLTGLLFIILTVQVRDRSVTGEKMKQILETSGVRVSMFSGSIDMCFSGDWPLTTWHRCFSISGRINFSFRARWSRVVARQHGMDPLEIVAASVSKCVPSFSVTDGLRLICALSHLRWGGEILSGDGRSYRFGKSWLGDSHMRQRDRMKATNDPYSRLPQTALRSSTRREKAFVNVISRL